MTKQERFHKPRNWRFHIELLPGLGTIVIRLPFNLGFSFWSPWWQFMFGVSCNDIGIEWRFGCFAGEIWREQKVDKLNEVEE